jgi:hypothetical protein
MGLLKNVLSNQTTSSETRKVMNKRNKDSMINNEERLSFSFNLKYNFIQLTIQMSTIKLF